MKKYIGLLILSACLSSTAFAEWTAANCTNRGGTIVQNVNNQSFCRSNLSMNWWSAHAWCKAHDGQLASITSWCPGSAIANSTPCNATTKTRVWLREVSSSNTPVIAVDYSVYFTDAAPSNRVPVALCE